MLTELIRVFGTQLLSDVLAPHPLTVDVQARFTLGPGGGRESSADVAPIAAIAATALLIAPIAATRPTRGVPVTSQVGGCVGWVSREAHRVLG